MPLSDDNKSHILRKNSVQEVSTVVDKNMIIANRRMKGGDAELNG
jgi:hypothetical protein